MTSAVGAKRLGLLCLALAGGACSVDDTIAHDGLFPCVTDADCGDGWGCFRAAPIARDFCAPLCERVACDGICAGTDTPTCLRGCRIAVDGSSAGCPTDFSCVRTSGENDDGVCFRCKLAHSTAIVVPMNVAWGTPCKRPIQTRRSDLTTYIVSRFRRMSLVPLDTNFHHWGPMGDLCLAACSISDTSCPIGAGCLTLLQRVSNVLPSLGGPVCEVGTFGRSCQDDTNCFIGRCLDSGTAQGKVCTLSCDRASALAGGCQNLVGPASLFGAFATMECDRTASSDDGSGLCAVRHVLSFPGCTHEERGAYPCASSLRCERVSLRMGAVDFCTRACNTTADCNSGIETIDWRYDCLGNRCLYRGIL